MKRYRDKTPVLNSKDLLVQYKMLDKYDEKFKFDSKEFMFIFRGKTSDFHKPSFNTRLNQREIYVENEALRFSLERHSDSC